MQKYDAVSTSILITGASSGIGAALARAYSHSGVTLFLGGRDEQRLKMVAAECRELGAEVVTAVVDVTERESMRQWIESCDRQKALELVIANAGISNAGEEHGEEYDRKIFAVNLDGVLNTVYPVIDLMRPRKSGQIAIMSSLAAMHGLARAPAYCASKAAIKTFGDAWRSRLRRDNIQLSVICPGFVKTPLTDKNSFPMPFMLQVDKAAKLIIKGLRCDQGLVVFPWCLYAILWLLKVLPHRLTQRILQQI